MPITTVVFLVSCDDAVDKEDGRYEHFFKSNSQLRIESGGLNSYMKYGIIEAGNRLVFEYSFVKNDKEEIADDEYSEVILFEIDPDLDEFAYSTDDFPEIKLVLSQYCFCFFESTELKNVAPSGTITGKKISPTKWEIQMDVIFYGDESRIVNAFFTLKNS